MNVSTFPSITWAEGRKDSGITHSNSVSPGNITLDAAGDYLVLVNIPLYSTSARVAVRAHVRLNGVTVNGGYAKQGFIRNVSGHNDSSLHWSGVVRSSSANQVLSIVTEQEAANGTVTFPTGKVASIYVEKLPSTKVYAGRATRVTGASPDQWNP